MSWMVVLLLPKGKGNIRFQGIGLYWVPAEKQWKKSLCANWQQLSFTLAFMEGYPMQQETRGGATIEAKLAQQLAWV
jgi:hypothetical protein